MEVQVLEAKVGGNAQEFAKGPLLIKYIGEWEELNGPNKENLAFRHLGQTEEGKQQYRREKAKGIEVEC